MKFASLALALLALPAVFADASPEPAPAAAEPHLEARTTCTNLQRANCYVLGMDMDSNCGCKFTTTFNLPQPCGDKKWTSCPFATSLAKCWDNGQTANALCQCVGTPTAPTTTPTAAAGTCNDHIKIATCALLGKKCDGNCNCVSGTPSIPSSPGTGWQTCGDSTKIGTCWKQGTGCNAKCVCETTTPTPSSTTPAPSATSTAAGTCTDHIKIAVCALLGKKADGSCNCVTGTPSTPSNPGTGWQTCGDSTKIGTCWKQGWGCNAKCVCETPTPSSSSSSTSTTKTSTSTTPSSTPTAVGTCKDFVQIALCALSGKKADGNCNCVTGTPVTPTNPGTGWQSCGDHNQIGNCWKQGWGCNAKCVCESTTPTPSASTSTSTSTSTTKTSTSSATPTPTPGVCLDFVKVALCALSGKKTDGGCKCITGTPTTPTNPGTGWQTCGDHNAIGNCWKQGWGCNAKCVCETPTPSSSSTTKTSTTSATPTPTPGVCLDFVKVALCALSGKKTDGACNCITGTPTTPTNPGTGWQTCGDHNAIGNCWKQGWGCNAKCVCETPTPSSSSTTKTSTTSATPTPTPGVCLDFVKVALCALSGKKTDGACNCITGTPTTPTNPGTGWQTCGDHNAIGNCWKQGWGCNAKCVCETPTSSSSTTVKTTSTSTTSTTKTSISTSSTASPTPTGTCRDWFKIAECHLLGKKTDGNCNCITGTPTVPGGGSDCKDPNSLANCWRVGTRCNSRCVCEPITSTTSSSSTVTTPATTSTSTTPTPTPTSVGQCKDSYKIQLCALRGLGVNSDCSCNKCNCNAQWECVKKSGTLDANCNCIVPSSTKRRRDATYVNNLCPKGQSACRIESAAAGWDGAFECVDTSRNIESCGGCVAEGKGVDCTAIEGVSDVACIAAKCVVSTCRKGWKVDAEHATCVPDSNAVKFQQKVGQGFWHL